MSRRTQSRMDRFLKECEEEGVALRRKLPEISSLNGTSRSKQQSPSGGGLRSPSPSSAMPIGAIERFNASVNNAFRFMPPHLALDEKWGRLTKWVSKYTHDEMGVRLAQLSQSLAGELKVKTASMPTPCLLRTASACVLMEQVLFLVCESIPVLKGLTQEVFFDVLQSVFPVCPHLTENGFHFLADPTDAKALHDQLSRYNSKTYFAVCRAMSHQGTEMESQMRGKTKQMNVVNRTVEHWQRYVMHRLLLAWRGHVAVCKREKAAQATGKKTELVLSDAMKRIAELEATLQQVEREHSVLAERYRLDMNGMQLRVQGLERELDLSRDKVDAALLGATVSPEDVAKLRTSVDELEELKAAVMADVQLWPLPEKVTECLGPLWAPEGRPDMLSCWAQTLVDHTLLDVSLTKKPIDTYLKLVHAMDPKTYTISSLRRDLQETDEAIQTAQLLNLCRVVCPMLSFLNPTYLADPHAGRDAYTVLSLGFLCAFCDTEGCRAASEPLGLVLSSNHAVNAYRRKRNAQITQRAYLFGALEQLFQDLAIAGVSKD